MTLSTATETSTTSLLGLLAMPRPSMSDSQIALRNILEAHIKTKTEDVFIDDYGNLFADVGTGSSTLFTCHLDTVDMAETKKVVSLKGSIASVKKGSCLGADDSTGIWLMCRMIDAGVPGLYAFFLDEEAGGRGSNYASRNAMFKWDEFKRCVSFDRKGYGDIITHQSMGRCASDKFAEALAEQLNAHGFDYAPSDGGTFTDSANFTDLIGECTNLSVGYFNQHTARETQDVVFAAKLSAALIKIDWESLPSVREAGEEDPDDFIGQSWYRDYFDCTHTPKGCLPAEAADLAEAAEFLEIYDAAYADPLWATRQILGATPHVELADIIEAEPSRAAMVLIEDGYSIDDFDPSAGAHIPSYAALADMIETDPVTVANIMEITMGYTLRSYLEARNDV